MQTVTNIFSYQLDMHWHENDWFASLEQALDGVTPAEAAWTSSGTSNSIWQIVNHLLFWNEDVIHRIKGTEIRIKQRIMKKPLQILGTYSTIITVTSL